MNKETIKNNEQFLKALADLNPSQKKAVEQIDGPVLVIAGPGTGKTQILAARIGTILLNTDTQAHNILCLTYTDAGAIAMRKRLFEFIGPDAYRVNIHTFHSFCNDIIQENLTRFGKLNLEAISDLEKIDLFRKLIHNLKAVSSRDHLKTCSQMEGVLIITEEAHTLRIWDRAAKYKYLYLQYSNRPRLMFSVGINSENNN